MAPQTHTEQIAELRQQLEQQTERNDALQTQQDKMLDLMIEMEERVKGATAPVVVGAPVLSEQDKLQAEMDAELAELRAEFKDFEGIEAAARRAESGTDANLDIRLRDEPTIGVDPDGTGRVWFLRWVNFGKEGRAQEIAAKGYVKVRIEELQDREAVGLITAQDEFVRKGERGLEVLHKMPLKLFRYMKRREQATRDGLLASSSRLRDHLANQTAAMASRAGENGDQAGSFVHNPKGPFRVNLTEQATETVTL